MRCVSVCVCVCTQGIIDGCVFIHWNTSLKLILLAWAIRIFYIPQAVNSIPYSHFYLFVAIGLTQHSNDSSSSSSNEQKNIYIKISHLRCVCHVYHRWLRDFLVSVFEWRFLSIFHCLHHMNYNRIVSPGPHPSFGHRVSSQQQQQRNNDDGEPATGEKRKKSLLNIFWLNYFVLDLVLGCTICLATFTAYDRERSRILSISRCQTDRLIASHSNIVS